MYGIYRKRDDACVAKVNKPLEAQSLLKKIETAYPNEWFEYRVWRGEEVMGKVKQVGKIKGS